MEMRRFLGHGVVAGAIGGLTLVVGGVGVAAAVNGGSLVLGSSNSATHTTTLTDNKGTPLSLITKHSKAPLKVSSRALVKNLNAGELGGLTAGSLSTGSSAQLKINLFGKKPRVVVLPQPTGSAPTVTVFPEAIVNTGKLAAGNYAVTATALAENTLCWLGTTAATGTQQYNLAGDDGGSVAVTSVFKVKKGQRVHFYCAGIDSTSGDPGGEVLSAGITALRLATASKGTVHSTAVAPETRQSIPKTLR